METTHLLIIIIIAVCVAAALLVIMQGQAKLLALFGLSAVTSNMIVGGSESDIGRRTGSKLCPFNVSNELRRANTILPNWGKPGYTVVIFRRKRAEYEYLMQHRSKQIWPKESSNSWGFISGNASAGDNRPAITALREVVEEAAPDLTHKTFKAACIQAIATRAKGDRPMNVVYILDADAVQASGEIPADWAGSPGLDPKEIDYSVVPSGHIWIPESDVDAIIATDQPMYNNVKLWRPTVTLFRRIRAALGYTNPVELYHGTKLSSVRGIIESGFQVNLACRDSSGVKCNACGMLGPGMYFGDLNKALSNASRSNTNQQEATPTAVLKCAVDLGRCKHITEEQIQPAPSTKLIDRNKYVDRCGCWQTPEGGNYDSVYLEPKVLSKRREWLVRDPAKQVRVIAYCVVVYRNWKLESKGPWIYVGDEKSE